MARFRSLFGNKPNAFAYHVGLDNQVVDIATDKKPKLYNEHVQNVWQASNKHRVWEAKIKIFDDGKDKNVGWKTADVFGQITLTKATHSKY